MSEKMGATEGTKLTEEYNDMEKVIIFHAITLDSSCCFLYFSFMK
jgi:hypothetical protein